MFHVVETIGRYGVRRPFQRASSGRMAEIELEARLVTVGLVLVQPAAKLAAGCIDGPPFGLAHRHADAPVAEDR